MTMADGIAVMNRGRIEQLGTPDDLYEHPQTAYVAGFLGVSNLLDGTVSGDDRVTLDGGAEVRVPTEVLGGRTGRVALGVRPEKIALEGGETNVISGRVLERAYIGVATQYVVETPHGQMSVYVQSAGQATPGDAVTLSFSPDSVFVVDPTEEVSE